jgi:hypothetical protein
MKQFLDQDGNDISMVVQSNINQIFELVSAKEFNLLLNNRKPAVFVAKSLDGNSHVGWHYASIHDKVGTTFHYDNGAGIKQDSEAMYVWVAPSTLESLKREVHC